MCLRLTNHRTLLSSLLHYLQRFYFIGDMPGTGRGRGNPCTGNIQRPLAVYFHPLGAMIALECLQVCLWPEKRANGWPSMKVSTMICSTSRLSTAEAWRCTHDDSTPSTSQAHLSMTWCRCEGAHNKDGSHCGWPLFIRCQTETSTPGVSMHACITSLACSPQQHYGQISAVDIGKVLNSSNMTTNDNERCAYVVTSLAASSLCLYLLAVAGRDARLGDLSQDHAVT